MNTEAREKALENAVRWTISCCGGRTDLVIGLDAAKEPT